MTYIRFFIAIFNIFIILSRSFAQQVDKNDIILNNCDKYDTVVYLHLQNSPPTDAALILLYENDSFKIVTTFNIIQQINLNAYYGKENDNINKLVKEIMSHKGKNTNAIAIAKEIHLIGILSQFNSKVIENDKCIIFNKHTGVQEKNIKVNKYLIWYGTTLQEGAEEGTKFYIRNNLLFKYVNRYYN